MSHGPDYSKWSNEDLIERVTKLEKELRETTSHYNATPTNGVKTKKVKVKKDFDASRYNTRLIALKFAYLGQNYNGYEHHANNTTPLPTIEEELWKALIKTKLIFPTGSGEVNWEGCEYSKCGRTDKGVSAFGQVVGLRVRSNERTSNPQNDARDEDVVDMEETAFDPIVDELPYPRLLNRVLPDDIRVLGWCSSPPPDFSARFCCRERRYRYFFTQPAYTPRVDALSLRQWRDGTVRKDGWLNIAAMREAASYFIGMHDFRNFCKHDPARQLTNFERNITHCGIEESPSSSSMPGFVSERGYGMTPVEKPKVYAIAVHGSAFLWHQVRHIAAILFHVGQGLEPPSIVKELLDVHQNPTKPLYEMADDAPLVLWDCIFPASESGLSEDALRWIYADGQPSESGTTKKSVSSSNGRFGPGGVQEVIWAGWRRKKMDEILAAALLDRVASQVFDLDTSAQSTTKVNLGDGGEILPFGALSTKVFEGGNGPRLKGDYTPIMDRERQENIEVLNARYAERKGLIVRATSTPAGREFDS